MSNRHDILIVGCGFAGAVLAERFASQRNLRVLLLERRPHLAGNMYDELDAAGVLVHMHGPHIFRTDSDIVWNYLNQFSLFNTYQHRVLASVNGKLVPVPFNLTSLEKLFGPAEADAHKARLLSTFGAEAQVPVAQMRRHPDPEISALGNFIFQKIYLNYSIKQWNERPENLDFETITRRVPVRISCDDRYFQHRHQGLPQEGYTRLFQRLLAHPNIEVRLNTDALHVLQLQESTRTLALEGQPFSGPVYYSGAVDELFGYRHGELPYRSLRFEFETLPQDRFQPAGVVNYPNDQAYTRITEYKHLTMQSLEHVTTIAKEYSQDNDPRVAGCEPYYPVPKAANQELYQTYAAEARRYPNLHLIGRLAEYRYYDMNDIITRALELFEKCFSS